MVHQLIDWAKENNYTVTIGSGNLQSATPNGPVILGAPGTTHTPGHAVVVQNGNIVFDPANNPTWSASLPFDTLIEIR